MSSTAMTAAELNELLASCDCLISPDQMEQAYDELAAQISAKLFDQLPLVLVVMNGGLISAGKLLARMHFPLELSYLHATRYRGATTGGALHWLAQPEVPLAGRQVLIIDDILDEGNTLKEIKHWCEQADAERVWVAVATDKQHDRKVPGITADFIGLTVPDRYIFGEGMDYKGYFRNLSGIYALPE